MKRKLLLLFVLLSLSIHILFSAHGNIVCADESKEIELEGNLPNPGTRTLLVPISAQVYSDYIEVTLLKSLGGIAIRIYDEANNMVYEDNADTSI